MNYPTILTASLLLLAPASALAAPTKEERRAAKRERRRARWSGERQERAAAQDRARAANSLRVTVEPLGRNRVQLGVWYAVHEAKWVRIGGRN